MTAVVAPGGSIRDQEIFAAADERKIAFPPRAAPALPALTMRRMSLRGAKRLMQSAAGRSSQIEDPALRGLAMTAAWLRLCPFAFSLPPTPQRAAGRSVFQDGKAHQATFVANGSLPAGF